MSEPTEFFLPHGMCVRDALPSDASALVKLVETLAQSLSESSPITEAYIPRFLAAPGSHVLLAEIERSVVGLLSYSLRPNLYHAADTALIEELVVAEGWQGKGIGGALLVELFSRLYEHGCAEVAVTTLPDNEGALRFYRRYGLVDEGILLEKHF